MPSSQGSHQAPVSTKHNTSLPHMHQQSLSTVVGTNLPEASNVNEVSPVLRRTPITTASRFQREDAAAAKCETIPPNKTVPSMPEDSSRNPAETKASRLQREQIEQSSWSMPVSSPSRKAPERYFDVADELRNFLEKHKLQHVVIEPRGGEEWLLGGMHVLLRPDTSQTPPQLFVSRDEGSSWILLEAVAEQYIRALRAARKNTSRDTAQDGELHTFANPQSQNQEWRPDGLPTFNDAFPSTFGAHDGASNYYASFRVRARKPANQGNGQFRTAG